MRPVRILTTAALSSLALGMGAATVHADTRPTLTVTPNPATAGSSVSLALNGGCDASTVTASSGAFTGSVVLSAGSNGTYRGTGTVRRDARAGSHTITIACPNGGPSSFTFTVRATSSPSPSPSPNPSMGARGGLGGSVTDMDSTKIWAGAALVTVAAAGTTLVLRRRAKH
ncbi:hypothetical protein [Streptomyces sp. NPDC059943]|uniref:hypothetical protein n=1 Tax=Streptomyces sp. NPDC059943 TaxID=3347010 RepID=UPI0036603B0C